MHQVGLEPNSRQKLHSFSLGMKQRYGLAAALIGDPELLILDEPLNSLDPQGATEMNVLLKTLCAEGKTILLSSHLLSELYKTATDYIFMDHGRIIQQLSHTALQERCNFRMTVHTERPQLAMELLQQQLPGLEDIHLAGEKLILSHCTASAVGVASLLRAEGLEAQIEISGMSLEEYLLQLVGNQESSGGA